MKAGARAFLALACLAAGPAGGQERDSGEGPFHGLRLPQPRRVVLGNGLVVLLLPDHELPLVHVHARIHAGSRLEPRAKLGLAWLAARLLRTGGTRSHPASSLDEELERLGAVLETHVAPEHAGVLLRCFSRDLPVVFTRFAEMLREPAFARERVDLALQDLHGEIAHWWSEPKELAERGLQRLLYGRASPYATSPTHATIHALSRADVLAWHARMVRPNRMVLGLVGDFDPEEALELVRTSLGDWERGPELEPPAEGVVGSRPPGVYTVEKPDATQSTIIMGHVGVRRDDPDWAAVEVLNDILGAYGSGRLFVNIRCRRGLSYIAQGGVYSAWDRPGPAFLVLSTKVGSTGEGIEALLQEARDLTLRPPTEEEVADARATLHKAAVFNLVPSRKFMANAVELEFHRRPADWQLRHLEALGRVTAEEVRAVARKHLRPGEFVILVVGPSEGRDRPLSDFGAVTPIDRELVGYQTQHGTLANLAQRGGFLIGKALAALGGADRVDSVTMLETSGRKVLRLPPGDVTLLVREVFFLPGGHLREEVLLEAAAGRWAPGPGRAGGRLLLGGIGGSWETLGAGRPACGPPGPPARSARGRLGGLERALRWNLVSLLQARVEPDFVARHVGVGVVAGTRVEEVAVEFDGDWAVLGIEPTSGRIVGLHYEGEGPCGDRGRIVHIFSDHRDLDGLSYPFATTTYLREDPVAWTRLEHVTVERAAFLSPGDR